MKTLTIQEINKILNQIEASIEDARHYAPVLIANGHQAEVEHYIAQFNLAALLVDMYTDIAKAELQKL